MALRNGNDRVAVESSQETPKAIYERFLAAVRERNRMLPKPQRLRVLACDPPIHWSRVKTAADAAPWLERDRFCAGVIEREVLAKGRRALVVMGDAHVSRLNLHGRLQENAIALVERTQPGSVFAVLTYLGQYRDSAAIEDRLSARTPPLLIPLAGTWLGALPARPPAGVSGGQVTSSGLWKSCRPSRRHLAIKVDTLGSEEYPI
jgi:hypothetical protein